jgi:hypothetical protein
MVALCPSMQIWVWLAQTNSFPLLPSAGRVMGCPLRGLCQHAMMLPTSAWWRARLSVWFWSLIFLTVHAVTWCRDFLQACTLSCVCLREIALATCGTGAPVSAFSSRLVTTTRMPVHRSLPSYVTWSLSPYCNPLGDNQQIVVLYCVHAVYIRTWFCTERNFIIGY